MNPRRLFALPVVALAGFCVLRAGGDLSNIHNVLTGAAAFTDFSKQSPGTFRKITPSDLPQPYSTPSAPNSPDVIAKPADAWPKTLPGFKVDRYAEDLDTPRELRTAPNGDLFVSESKKGEVLVFRGMTADGKAKQHDTFATGLRNNFGIAFYPPGPNPKYIYLASTDSVVRYPYKNGDLKATASPEKIIPELPAGGGHWTRDLAFSPDGSKLFVSVGSASNVDDPDTHPRENHRANILEYTPQGKFVKVYAAGIRNPVGIAINPTTSQLWCSVNERDALGDNLVPDYVSSVKEGGFYGWPWFYMGDHQDPRHQGKHPELKDKTIVPDVLLQPHNASLQLTFYSGKQFPKQYWGDLFAAEHGSWNKAKRTGYEVIRVPLADGKANGVYEDFVTGFVTPDGGVWGRPVGVATSPDGSLMVSDDGSKSIWRVHYVGK